MISFLKKSNLIFYSGNILCHEENYIRDGRWHCLKESIVPYWPGLCRWYFLINNELREIYIILKSLIRRENKVELKVIFKEIEIINMKLKNSEDFVINGITKNQIDRFKYLEMIMTQNGFFKFGVWQKIEKGWKGQTSNRC